MAGLSEVSTLIGQRAGELEKAQEVFSREIRAFISDILRAIRQLRSDPWITAPVKIDLPKDIDSESKSGSLSNQCAIARPVLRFKRATLFVSVADVRFGIEYDEQVGSFMWLITLVPVARYHRIDDAVWHQWQKSELKLPESVHQDKANIVRFVCRPLNDKLTAEVAFNDVKSVLEFLLTTGTALRDAIGLEPLPEEEPQVV